MPRRVMIDPHRVTALLLGLIKWGKLKIWSFRCSANILWKSTHIFKLTLKRSFYSLRVFQSVCDIISNLLYMISLTPWDILYIHAYRLNEYFTIQNENFHWYIVSNLQINNSISPKIYINLPLLCYLLYVFDFVLLFFNVSVLI